MASSVDDFRSHNRETLTLPSGLTVDILKKPQASIFLGLGELPVPSATEGQQASGMSPGEIVSLKRYTDRAIARSVLAPPLSDAFDDGGVPALTPGRLHVTELEADDYASLSNAILTRMGLVQEVARDIQAFRTDPVFETGEGAGPGVPLLTFDSASVQPE